MQPQERIFTRTLPTLYIPALAQVLLLPYFYILSGTNHTFVPLCLINKLIYGTCYIIFNHCIIIIIFMLHPGSCFIIYPNVVHLHQRENTREKRYFIKEVQTRYRPAYCCHIILEHHCSHRGCGRCRCRSSKDIRRSLLRCNFCHTDYLNSRSLRDHS